MKNDLLDCVMQIFLNPMPNEALILYYNLLKIFLGIQTIHIYRITYQLGNKEKEDQNWIRSGGRIGG